MPIYTRVGDQGETNLVGGVRLCKDAALLEACGSLDELNALLGVVRSELSLDSFNATLELIQRQLFTFGIQLVADASNQPTMSVIGAEEIAGVEQAIDRCEAALPPIHEFILPCGCRAAAMLHAARAVCRRTERRLVSLARTQLHENSSDLLAYINRLGDLLFVLARMANSQVGIADTIC